ncbi:hypothetical protein HK102_012305, partial [Quaeritorhiza haematococci]
ITLTAPGNLKYGRRSYINYDDSRQFRILLPELTTPFGAKRWHDEGKDPSTDQIQIDVAFQGKDKRVVLAKEKLKEIDEHIMKLIHEKADQFYPGRNASREFVAEKFRETVKTPRDAKGNVYSKRMKLKIVRNTNEPNQLMADVYTPLQFVDKDKKLMDVDVATIETAIPRDSKVIPVIQPMMVFIASNQGVANITWKLVKAMVKHPSKSDLADFDFDMDGMDGSSSSSGGAGVENSSDDDMS